MQKPVLGKDMLHKYRTSPTQIARLLPTRTPLSLSASTRRCRRQLCATCCCPLQDMQKPVLGNKMLHKQATGDSTVNGLIPASVLLPPKGRPPGITARSVQHVLAQYRFLGKVSGTVACDVALQNRTYEFPHIRLLSYVVVCHRYLADDVNHMIHLVQSFCRDSGDGSLDD